ncbi:MAG: helix-turn-helix transcriptional regulator [Clostridia bacterium]|nr:helix-turn-helix transcriptional regulator [Clostridia bacterium]
MTLGERIKEQRTKAKMSQEKLAELVGVSRQAVTKWEAGQSSPSTENLFRIAEVLGTTVDILTK